MIESLNEAPTPGWVGGTMATPISITLKFAMENQRRSTSYKDLALKILKSLPVTALPCYNRFLILKVFPSLGATFELDGGDFDS